MGPIWGRQDPGGPHVGPMDSNIKNTIRHKADKPSPEPMLRYMMPFQITMPKWADLKGYHDDVIKWKHFPHNWPFVQGIHRSLVNSLHKGQWRGALIFSLICASINGWVNNGDTGNLRYHCTHYDVIVIISHPCNSIMAFPKTSFILLYTINSYPYPFFMMLKSTAHI